MFFNHSKIKELKRIITQKDETIRTLQYKIKQLEDSQHSDRSTEEATKAQSSVHSQTHSSRTESGDFFTGALVGALAHDALTSASASTPSSNVDECDIDTDDTGFDDDDDFFSSTVDDSFGL